MFNSTILTSRDKKITPNRAKAQMEVIGYWCGRRDLNSYGVTHTPLKRARLPVPPRPHMPLKAGSIIILFEHVSVKNNFRNPKQDKKSEKKRIEGEKSLLKSVFPKSVIFLYFLVTHFSKSQPICCFVSGFYLFS